MRGTGGEVWEGRCGRRGSRGVGGGAGGQAQRGGTGREARERKGYKADPLMDYKVVPHPTS